MLINVRLTQVDSPTVFPAYTNPREEWAEQFRIAVENGPIEEYEDRISGFPNIFDHSDWTWQ